MKKIAIPVCLIVIAILLRSCVKNTSLVLSNPSVIDQAKEAFQKSIGSDTLKKIPLWQFAFSKTIGTKTFIKVPLKIKETAFVQLNGEQKIPEGLVSSLIMYKDESVVWAIEVLEKIPDSIYLHALSKDRFAAFSGAALRKSWDNNIIRSTMIAPPTSSLREGPNGNSIVCTTIEHYTCLYAVSSPDVVYCNFNYSETSCYGAPDVVQNLPQDDNSPGGGGVILSPAYYVLDVHATGKLCGYYSWTETGVNGLHAQMNSFGFSLVNTNGQILTFKFDNLCVQAPKSSLNNSPSLASEYFNDAWAYGLEEAVKRANDHAVLGEFFVKQNMVADMRLYFDTHFRPKSWTLTDDVCAGAIKPSAPDYCH